MVITIYGEDTFRSREFLRSTIDQFKKKRDPSGLNIHTIDATQTSLLELARQDGMLGLFGSQKRLFVVERIEEAKQNAEELTSFMEQRKSAMGNVICFYIRGKLMGSLGKILGAATYAYPFTPLLRDDLEWWVRDRALSYGSEISQSLPRLLVAKFQSDLWAIDRELAALSAMACGGPIAEQEYRAREVASHDYSQFELAEWLLSGRRKEACQAFSRIPKHEWIPFVMLLASHVRGLVWLKEGSNKRGSDGSKRNQHVEYPLNPFFAKKLSKFESRVTMRELFDLSTSLIASDVEMKTTPVDPSALVLRRLL